MNDINTRADINQKDICKHYPATHFLSNPKSVDNMLLWTTFFKRNLHRFAADYLGLKLYPYQLICLYYLGICKLFVMMACRAAAKSYIIAIYACCRAILYPNSWIVIGSKLVKQSRLIVSEKIKNELCHKSPVLRREILDIKDSPSECVVTFKNGSTIKVVNDRGPRSHVNIREEFNQMEQVFNDEVLLPMQIVWKAPYTELDYYKEIIDDVRVASVDIYISSAGLDNGRWVWKIADTAYKGMLNNNGSYFFAFDESVVLKHDIKTKPQLLMNLKTMDPITFQIEIKNRRIKENTAAFFTYTMLMQNQICKKPFYPLCSFDARIKKKNPYFIPKQKDEIRIIAVDMAFVNRKGNDRSSFTLIRALPESITYRGENKKTEVKRGYHRVVPYIESRPGGDTDAQALRIRQLYEDFEADYIVLDTRNGGVTVYYKLAKVMYDEERDCEYAPLSCMNDNTLAESIKIDGAKPVIFAINASAKLNSDIATIFKETLISKMIEFLVNVNVAKDEILSNYKEYATTNSVEVQLEYEKPFFETQLMIAETAGLVYEKKEQTGTIIISEQGSNMKDRYTSVSYGNYFISLLEQDLLSESENINFNNYTACVSSVDF